MVLTTVKAVRDTDRDAEGRVKEARCDEGFWLSLLLVPLVVLAIIIGYGRVSVACLREFRACRAPSSYLRSVAVWPDGEETTKRPCGGAPV